MSKGRVIENQRFGKVIKKANQYPQIWYVNLETLCLVFLKTEKKQKQKQNYNFSEIFSCQAFLLIQHCVESDLQEKNRFEKTIGAKLKKWNLLCFMKRTFRFEWWQKVLTVLKEISQRHFHMRLSIKQK